MDRSDIDRILEVINIVDVIQSYFPLQKAGTNYKALCPFHHEDTPSFVVSEKKQIYRCFGCGQGGNVINFVQEYEKVSFPEALKILAARAGIKLQDRSGTKKKDTKRDLIIKIYTLAAGYYHDNLIKYGSEVKEYLKKRSVSSETIEKFQLGYALNSYNGLKNYLLKNSINEKILQNTGLFSEGTQGTFDTFRNRLMFPIHSVTGKVVAFGGRVLAEDQSGGKYINSPTTEIYTKGNELYGLFSTRYDISRQDNALVCEGYTDFIRLIENGFTNTVASLGTSLTDQQLNLISRYTRNLYLIYDGDKAGLKAAIRAAGNALSKGMSVRIVKLPETDDPDSFLVNNSREKLQEIIDSAQNPVHFLKNDQILGLSVRDKLDQLIEIVNQIRDQISRQLFIKEIADTFKLPERALLSEVRIKRLPSRPEQSGQVQRKYQEERELLKYLLTDKRNFKKVASELNSDYFLIKIHRELYEFLNEQSKNSEEDSAYLDMVEDPALRNTIAELMLEDIQEEDFSEILRAVKLRKLQHDLYLINNSIEKDPENSELKQERQELKKNILQLDRKIVRKTLY